MGKKLKSVVEDENMAEDYEYDFDAKISMMLGKTEVFEDEE